MRDVDEVIAGTKRAMLRAAAAALLPVGVAPTPQVAVFDETNTDQPLVAMVTCREYRRGDDAAKAITHLGRLAGALCNAPAGVLGRDRPTHVAARSRRGLPAGFGDASSRLPVTPARLVSVRRFGAPVSPYRRCRPRHHMGDTVNVSQRGAAPARQQPPVVVTRPRFQQPQRSRPDARLGHRRWM